MNSMAKKCNWGQCKRLHLGLREYLISVEWAPALTSSCRDGHTELMIPCCLELGQL